MMDIFSQSDTVDEITAHGADSHKSPQSKVCGITSKHPVWCIGYNTVFLPPPTTLHPPPTPPTILAEEALTYS